jgi:hypothetical protein
MFTVPSGAGMKILEGTRLSSPPAIQRDNHINPVEQIAARLLARFAEELPENFDDAKWNALHDDVKRIVAKEMTGRMACRNIAEGE